MQWPTYKKNTEPRKKKRPVQKKKPAGTSAAAKVLRKQIFIGVGIFILLGVLLTAVWYVTRIESLQIQSVEVVGGKTIDIEMMKERVYDQLEGEYFRLVPRSFTWWYPESDIISSLQSVSRVKEVRVVSKKKQHLEIAFTEYEPVALWCGKTDTKNCLFIDVKGFAFATAPELTGSALVRYYTDEEPAVKTTALTREVIDVAMKTAERLEDELGLYVIAVTVDDIDVTYHIANGGELKVTMRMSVEESVTNLQSILTSDEFIHLADGDFHYIDLRFGDKVFVSESEVVASSTASSTKPVVEIE